MLQSPRINFVLSDIANTPQFQPSWRWPLWCYRSPQDVSTGHGWCHGDNPWKFRNDVIVYGTKIVLRLVKPIGNEKKWWISYYGVAYKLNSNPNLTEFLIGQFILEVTFSIRLGPLWWVPTAHCAGRRGLNLLTAVRPVELAHGQYDPLKQIIVWLESKLPLKMSSATVRPFCPVLTVFLFVETTSIGNELIIHYKWNVCFPSLHKKLRFTYFIFAYYISVSRTSTAMHLNRRVWNILYKV